MNQAVALARRLNAFLRFYVATSPEEAEARWQLAERFERLPADLKEPGHWYRFAGSSTLIEVNAKRDGQWHPDGKLPEDVPPEQVVEVPAGDPAPTLLDHLLAILGEIPGDAPKHAEVVAIGATLTDLPTSERAARLALTYQKALASVPRQAGRQLAFLRQACLQMVGVELLAGRVCGYDVAGALLVRACAETLAAANAERCAGVLAAAAAWKVSAIGELAARLVEACWFGGLGTSLQVGFDAIRDEGEKNIESARECLYPEGHPELALDIYYGGLLQAVPYLLAANAGYFKLSKAPAAQEVVELAAHRANTAEEKLVRLTTALKFAIDDLDGTQLADKRARLAAVLRAGDQQYADRLVHEIVDLEFYYPPRFRSILLGIPEPDRPGA